MSTPDKWGGEWFVNVGRALRELAKMRQERDKGWDSRCQRLVDWAIDIEQLTPPSARNANAERYEWLRSHSWVDISLIKSVLNFGPGYQQTKPEILDAAIDAELARSDGKGDSNAS